MFQSFFPRPSLFLLSAIIWSAIGVAFWFVFGDDLPKLSYITILDAWILLSYLFAGLSSMITI